MTTYYKIPTKPINSTFNCVFPNGNTYFFRLKFLPDSDTPTWSLDIFDSNNILMIGGLPLVTGCNLLEQYEYLGLGVQMFCTTDGADPLAVPTLENLGTSSSLWIASPR